MIGRLKEKYPQIAKLYSVQVIPEAEKDSQDPKLKAIALNWEKNKKYEPEVISEGSYVLRTDRIDLSDEGIWNTYLMLGNIEYAWLTMKSYLGLRPMSTHQRVTITIAFRMKDEEGKITQKFIRTCTVPEVEHKKIYKIFGLSGKTARISSLVQYCSDHRKT